MTGNICYLQGAVRKSTRSTIESREYLLNRSSLKVSRLIWMIQSLLDLISKNKLWELQIMKEISISIILNLIASRSQSMGTIISSTLQILSHLSRATCASRVDLMPSYFIGTSILKKQCEKSICNSCSRKMRSVPTQSLSSTTYICTEQPFLYLLRREMCSPFLSSSSKSQNTFFRRVCRGLSKQRSPTSTRI